MIHAETAQLVLLFVLPFAKMSNGHRSALPFQVIEPALGDHLSRNAQVKDMSVGVYVVLGVHGSSCLFPFGPEHEVARDNGGAASGGAFFGDPCNGEVAVACLVVL